MKLNLTVEVHSTEGDSPLQQDITDALFKELHGKRLSYYDYSLRKNLEVLVRVDSMEGCP